MPDQSCNMHPKRIQKIKMLALRMRNSLSAAAAAQATKKAKNRKPQSTPKPRTSKSFATSFHITSHRIRSRISHDGLRLRPASRRLPQCTSPFQYCVLQLRHSPSRDPQRSPVVVVVVDSSAVLTRNLVVPTHSCPMSACAVVLVVHESTCLKHSPVPTNLPSVIRTVVRHLAGGAPATRSGVKSSRLGLWCTRLASSLSRHHSSAALWALRPPFCGTGQRSRPSTVVSW